MSLFDCKPEEELEVLLKFKDKAKTFSSCDEHIVKINFERKSETLSVYVKQLVESHNLDAIQAMKEMLIGDPKLAAGLKPFVFERLVKILVENDIEYSTKGSAACVLAFADLESIKKKEATEVLVNLMSHDCDTISIPVLRTLTRLAYKFADYASFIIEKGALEGALAVSQSNSPSFKRIQNLAKFLVVVVRQVNVLSQKAVGTVVTILDMILEIRESNLRYIVRACDTLSHIAVKHWINKGNIYGNLIYFIRHRNDMVAYSALRAVGNIVKSRDSWKMCEILTEDPNKFLRCLGRIEICCKPKKFQKEFCLLISNTAANIADKGRSSVKDMNQAGLIDALSKLLEVDEVDVKKEAAQAICKVVRG
ncbi:hypothetical protein POM88_032949 [Heracleum sosnowskyi]|uniref:Uncharacterized protein n=1 Tax=Heracleum sosnowskyi TaxID=360622 RepID=A0AAD8MKK5_9APIA|nr:hypothetical protein POM88_032949 [Heracleum sosnowskyi]